MKLFAQQHPCGLCGNPYDTEQEAVECAVRHAGVTPSSQSHRLRKRAKPQRKAKGKPRCRKCTVEHETKRLATDCCKPRYPW